MKENKIHDAQIPIWFGSAFIFLLAFAAYWPALRGAFIWDDTSMIRENFLVTERNGLFSIWFSTKPIDYFPLTYSSFWLEWRLWGANPTGYHVANLLLHAGSCVLMWRVLARLKVPGAWLASLLFLVHPVNVESVAWIAERKNTLCLFFYGLSLLLFLRSEKPDASSAARKIQYTLALVAFLFSLLSKTASVALPFVLLGMSWWQRRRISKADLLRALPFFGLALVMGLVTIWFQYNRAIGEGVIHNRDFWTRLAAAGWAVWFYLFKAILPVDLAFVYSEWTVDSHSPLSYVPGIALLGVFIVLWRFRKSWGRPWLFALGYFVLLLFPVLGFFKIYFQRYSFVADHWQYFALPAVVTMVASGSVRLLDLFLNPTRNPNLNPADTEESKIKSRIKIKNCIAWFLGASLVLTLSAATWRQSRIYRDEETLWRDTLKKNPRCWLAHNNLGLILKSQGKRDEALQSMQRSLQIRPDQYEAHNNLGVLLYEQGKLDEAMEQYRASLQAYPKFADTHVNLGTVLDLRGQPAEAIQEYRIALQLNPNITQAHNNLGCLLLVDGKLDEAIAHFHEALKTSPASVDALSNLGGALVEQGRAKEAMPYLLKAVQINPRHANAHFSLGNALLATGQFSEALARFAEALQLQPELVRAHFKSGLALLNLGKNAEAIKEFSLVLAQQPESFEAQFQIASALAREKKIATAIEHYEEAVRLKPDWPVPLNSLAWLLATTSDAPFRDGKLAVELAERAVRMDRNASLLDTLAAAYAEASRFDDAVKIAAEAKSLVEKANDKKFADEIEQRLKLYQSQRPFRE